MTIQFPTVDWTTLIPTLVGLFFGAIGDWLNRSLTSTFTGIFGMGVNVVTQTPMDMTWELGPISGSIRDLSNASNAILVFALALLGVRGILSAVVPYQPDLLGDAVNGFLGAIVLMVAFPVMVPRVIDMLNALNNAIAVGALRTYLFGLGGTTLDPLTTAVLFIVLLFFVFRLLVKTVWRVGFLAVLLPVGWVACMLYAIPQTRWILGWWSRLWGGMLIAQAPSTLALAIGLQMSSFSGTGLGVFVYSIAFIQLAHDLYDLIPFGGVKSQGSPIGAALTAASLARMVAGLGGGAAVSVGQAAAQMRSLSAMDRASADQRFYGYD